MAPSEPQVVYSDVEGCEDEDLDDAEHDANDSEDEEYDENESDQDADSKVSPYILAFVFHEKSKTKKGTLADPIVLINRHTKGPSGDFN